MNGQEELLVPFVYSLKKYLEKELDGKLTSSLLDMPPASAKPVATEVVIDSDEKTGQLVSYRNVNSPSS